MAATTTLSYLMSLLITFLIVICVGEDFGIQIKSVADGYKLVQNYDTSNDFVVFDLNQNDEYSSFLERLKRGSSRDYVNVYPDYEQGYYVYPKKSQQNSYRRKPAGGAVVPNSIRRDEGNYQYNPVYKTLKTKKKRLFVPNLFG